MSDTPKDSDPLTPRIAPRHSWLRRYMSLPTILVLAFVVYLIFFGDNSVARRVEYQNTIDSLNQCLAQQNDSLSYYRDLNRRLSTDPELMEQVVREQYNMNRPNEDVYIME